MLQKLSFFIRFVSPISLQILNVFSATFINLKTLVSGLFFSDRKSVARHYKAGNTGLEIRGRKYRAGNTGPEIKGWKYRAGNTGPEIQGRKYRTGNSRPEIQGRKLRAVNTGPEINGWKYRTGNTGLASRNIYSAQSKSTCILLCW